MRYATIAKRMDSIRDSLVDLYGNAARFYWNSDKLHAHRIKLLDTNPYYQKLPYWARQNILGVDWLLKEQLLKKLVFSYVVHGERLTLFSKKYREYSSYYIYTKCVHTGAYVWKESPNSLFTQPVGKPKK